MRITFKGNLNQAAVLLSESRHRPDYLNSFLENARFLGVAYAYFNGDYSLPEGTMSEHHEWLKGGPYLEVNASGKSIFFAFPMHNLAHVGDPETLEKIVGSVVATAERPIFKKVKSQATIGEPADNAYGLLRGEYFVAEMPLQYVEFLPLADYVHNANLEISRRPGIIESEKGFPQCTYSSSVYDGRVVDARIHGGKNIMDSMRSYLFARAVSKAMPESRVIWSGFGLKGQKVLNQGYDWNSGNPIMLARS